MLEKRAILDASSAIILFKVDLHVIVTEMYSVVMPGSVYKELTLNSYPGAKTYKQFLADTKITIKEPLYDTTHRTGQPGLTNLDQGEYDVINLYYGGKGDFIITDDGAAARYCQREGIPFVNALLVPQLLSAAGVKDENFCRQSMDKIINIGRYSAGIITFAEEVKRDDLSFFVQS